MQKGRFMAIVAALSMAMILVTTSVASAASFNFNFKNFNINSIGNLKNQFYSFFVNPINKPGNGPKPCNPGHFGYGYDCNVATTTIFECNKGEAGSHNPHCTNSTT